MRKLQNFLRQNYLHIICVWLTIEFVSTVFFMFPDALVRFWECLVDLWNSLLYFFGEMFYVDLAVPTVNNYSSIDYEPFLGFPETWSEFELAFSDYWSRFASSDNITAYFSMIGNFLVTLFKFLVLLGLPLGLIVFLLIRRTFKKQNNNFNVDSKPLVLHKLFVSEIYLPVKNFVKSLWYFIYTHKVYWVIWLVIWAFNFNLIAVAFEFVAWYLFFVFSFDFTSIYIQLYKLFCDLSVMINFVPLVVWLVLGFVLFNRWRKKIGYRKLQNFEMRNRGFINERPLVIMLCGTMGKKKTTLLTDISLSVDAMFREIAFEKLLENDLKFPNFPWINLENALQKAIKKHQVYNLATCRKFIRHLAYCCNNQTTDKQIQKSINRHFRKRFDIKHKNLIFDYDYPSYGLFSDNKLYLQDIWGVIETYAQLYFVYILQSSYLLSNYAIRTDNLISSAGNFPMWDTDFFQRDSKVIDFISRHSHILDFDSLRLGKKMIEDNAFKDSFEFGIVDITEIGKERKNNLELQEKKKGDFGANQKNDGFNHWLKMARHSATIDNYPFVRVFTDEQRPESWGADARDLTDIIHIRSSSEPQLAMPFFALTELVHSALFNKFTNKYYEYRFNRSDNTLLMHLFKGLTAKFHNYYTGIYNTFGFSTLQLQVENGVQDGNFDDRKYYLCNKKIYAKRFSTDAFSDFFAQKSLKSPVGLDDLPEYATEKATFEELKHQNSYFIDDLTNRS